MYGAPIRAGRLVLGPEDWLKLQVAEVRGRPVLMGEVEQECGVREREWQLLWQKKEGDRSVEQRGIRDRLMLN